MFQMVNAIYRRLSPFILPECEALAASERRWQDGLVPTPFILPECEALAASERRTTLHLT